jgi:hypothetical protein
MYILECRMITENKRWLNVKVCSLFLRHVSFLQAEHISSINFKLISSFGVFYSVDSLFYAQILLVNSFWYKNICSS